MKAEIVNLADKRREKLKPSAQDDILLENCDKVPWYVVNRLLLAAGYDSMDQTDMVKRIRLLKNDNKWKPVTSLQCGELLGEP